MHYLIDGYNLLFQVNEDVNPLSDARHNIIETLALGISTRKWRASIIFDSSYQHASLFPTRWYHGCLEIIYSPQGQCADRHIIEKLQAVKNPKLFTVVTSDNWLSRESEDIGAYSLPIPDFLLVLHKKKKGKTSEKRESPQEMQRLEEIFTKRLKTNDEE